MAPSIVSPWAPPKLVWLALSQGSDFESELLVTKARLIVIGDEVKKYNLLSYQAA